MRRITGRFRLTRRAVLIALVAWPLSPRRAAAQVRLRVRPSAGGGGGGDPEEHGYTETHYVAPFGSVSGSTSDLHERGATAWTNATNPSTPTTLGTALARAVAGNIVQMAPGTYEEAVNGRGAAEPMFAPANAGTSGNLIIFTAQYPAPYNLGDDTRWTKFKRTSDPAVGASTCPIWGSRNYSCLDGVSFTYGDGANPHTRGIIYFGYQITGMEVRRLLFDRTFLDGADDGDNYNCIHHHNSTSAVMRDCLFRNGYDGGGSHNEAAITLYGARDFLIENCQFEDVTIPIFCKGTDAGQGNRGTIRYNHITGAKFGVEMSTTLDTGTDTIAVTQNLIALNSAAQATHGAGFENATTGGRYFLVTNNTIIGSGGEEAGPVSVESGYAGTGCVFRDNIVANFSATTQVMVNAQASLASWSAFDYNRYYANGSTPTYFITSTQTGIANWRTASSRDANSTEGDPGFVNQASGDYHLAGGSACLTASSTSGPVGCYIIGTEEIGLRAAPSY